MDTHAVGFILIKEEYGIVVRIDLLIAMEHIAPPGVDIFLQTDDIRILTGQIVINRIEALIFLKIVDTRIGADVVRQELNGAIGHVLGRVHRHIES